VEATRDEENGGRVLEAKHMDALVIGAGVVGLSSAVVLAEAGMSVVVETAELPGRTTSAAAGAVWDPYLTAPRDRALAWALRSLDEFRRAAADPARTGVRIGRGTQQSKVPCRPPYWTEHVGARICEDGELAPGYATGWGLEVPVLDAPVYLGHLAERLRRAGGRIRVREYRSLDGAGDRASVVVNCTGVGARNLLPDPSVWPLKGQLVVVENPGLTEFFCDDTPDADEYLYFYPHGGSVSLGGSQEPGAWSPTPDADVARRIVKRCAEIEPRLAGARILGHRAGLRPMRSEVRLCRDDKSGSPLIHNYGHGGAGVTLSWGCALEVLALVRECLS
jgi:D-amino-acid oxidase